MCKNKFIDFIITQNCTYKCPYCIQAKGFQKEYLNADKETIDNFLRFLDTIDKDFEITLSGGEAMLHSDFFNLINEIKLKGFKINLITNLSFKFEKYKLIFDSLQDSLNNFDISFHLDEIDDFDVLKSKLIELLSCKNKSTNIFFHIPIYMLNNKKEEQISFLQKIADEYNINVDFQHIRLINNYIKYNENEKKYFKDEKYIKSFGRFCLAGCNSAIIYQDGSVYRCYSSRLIKTNYLGNINDKDFKLKTKGSYCVNKLCTCPKPNLYRQISDKKSYIFALILSLYNILFIPKLFLKNKSNIFEKLSQILKSSN